MFKFTSDQETGENSCAGKAFGAMMTPMNGISRLVLCLLLLSLIVLVGCGSDPGPEVWVIGLDGADWDQLDPMIALGELPNLAALKAGGAAGMLRSEKPLLSPVVWTTIATGRPADEHGVTWFMTDAADGTKTPVSSSERKVRSFWNIASEAGINSGVVGWWATWPADPINGFVVSDYVGWHSFGVSGNHDGDAGKTWPTELMTTVRSLMPDPAQVSTDQLAAMVNWPAARLAYDASAEAYGDPLNHLRQAVATSRGYTDVVLNRLDKERPTLLAVYYEGTDAVSHLFGDFQAPRQPWVSQADYDAYHKTVDEYWKWQDQLIGQLMARRGPRTTVIVCSDHGFRVGDERRKEDAFHIETAEADHMLNGIVIVNGPGVEAGASLQDASIYDITPTVLYALDLPVAANMPGRVLTDALAPGVVAADPVRSVVTYETSPMIRQEGVSRPAGAAADMEKMLRSLGYISGAKSGESAATHKAPEEAVNMATVLMRQGKFAEAIAILRATAVDNPELFEVQLNLAQALVRSGQPTEMKEGEALYRALLEKHPARLELHEDLTTFLLNANRNQEAVAVCKLGLQQDPNWVNGLAALGRAQVNLGRNAEAEATLRHALLEDPRHARANLALGELLVRTNRATDGLPFLEAAHRLDPADADTALHLAAALQGAKRFDAALQVLQSCLEEGGPQPDLLAEKGAVLMRQGQNTAALAPLQQAVQLDPANTLAMGNLGMAFAKTGNMTSAASTFEKIVELKPEMADAHAELGALYAQTGQLVPAEKEMRKAVELDPGNLRLLLNLGQVYALSDRADQARQTYQKALRLNPEFVPALVQLGKLEQKLGNQAEANRLLQKAQSYDKVGRSGK